jgi:hypothetical protein
MHGFHHPPQTLSGIVETLRKGDLPDHPIPIDDSFLRARYYAAEAFRPPRLIRPVHFADLRYYYWNWHPNVELPYSKDKDLIRAVNAAATVGLLANARMSFGNLKNFVFMDVRHYLHRLKRNQIHDPATLFPAMMMHAKPALTTPDEIKIRAVFGVSKRHVLPSAQFFWPLFRYYIEEHTSPLYWGYETILGGMMKMHQVMSIPRFYYRTFVIVDWSGFDLRALFSLIDMIFQDWRTYFDFENGYIPTRFYRSSTADPQQLERVWDWICEATKHMPLRLPDGSMYRRLHRGVASGLFSTQFLDSHYNLIMIYTILDALGFQITRDFKVFIQGDDSNSLLRFHIPADQHDDFKARFSALAIHYFDHIARPDKTKIFNSPQGVEILGYANRNGYPVRDWRKLLAQLYHPRGAYDENVLAARCCGIQYASMYLYPEVTRVCKDIYTYLTAKRGVIPSRLHKQRDVIMFGESEFEVPTDHFPTREDVTRYLRVPYSRTPTDSDAYFPSWHFLDTA